MARIVEGAALVAAAVVTALVPGLQFFTPAIMTALVSGLGSVGASLILGGIAQLLSEPSLPFSIRAAAAPRQLVYGQCRVAGVFAYMSTSNGGKYLNQVVMWTGHSVQSIDAIYLDARLVVPSVGGADGSDHTDDSGNTYNFGGNVLCRHSLGPIPGTYFSELGATDSKWDSTCTLDGIAASYIRCNFDATVFPTEPGIKANIHGKNDIYDPRTGTRGYTNNLALCIADCLCDDEWGFGFDMLTDIDQDQLVAAANLCDEQVVVAAAGVGTESRYTCNGFADTSSAAGDIIDSMLMCCEGNLTYTGGKVQIYPAAFWGSGLFFDESAFAGPVKWISSRKYRDKVNAVRATFISPKYPYAVIGYDQDNRDPAIFSGQWQPTDAPEYAQDADHGYVSDANLIADGNVKLYADRSYRWCTSVSTCQRLQKIFLMRNRNQGSGTLKMQLQAYECRPQDVIQLTFNGFNWVDKYLEVKNVRFNSSSAGGPDGSGKEETMTLQVEIDVVETDPSVYTWSPGEELGLDNSTSPLISNTWQVNPPTSILLESGLDSAVAGLDGITIPRIHVSWIEPDDPFVISGGSVEIQLFTGVPGAGTWVSIGHFGPTLTDYFITGVVAGQTYYVQMRSVRANGATSGFIEVGPHTVSLTMSVITTSIIGGLGALATRNSVDFASGVDILNRTANNLHYTTGLSVDSLMPAESGSERTAGKSLDVLIDGTLFARTKQNQLASGYVLGKSYGSNMLGNPGFEANAMGTTLNTVPGAVGNWFIDEWQFYEESPPSTVHFQPIIQSNPASSHNGNNCLLIRMPSANPTSNGDTCRVVSSKYPCTPGNGITFGGFYRWAANAAMPAGGVLTQRMGILFTDVNDAYVAESSLDNIQFANGTPVNIPWTYEYGVLTVPPTAAFARFQCAIFNQGVGFGTGATDLVADLFWDDLFMEQMYQQSSVLSQQGSIIPTQLPVLSYTVTSSSITFTWPLTNMRRSDGFFTIVPSGTTGFGGLSAGTTYYFYFYVDVVTSTMQYANSAPPPSSPDSLMALNAGLDGRIPIDLIKVTTLAGAGTGSGTGGGGNTCPEAAELVNVQGKGNIAAGTVAVGDMIQGKSFHGGVDVYRKVIQVQKQSCAAWRMVGGHRVSPCESVWSGTAWTPAYRMAGSTFDTMDGVKILISVETDEYDEQNYYLTSGTELLIHNIGMQPC